jgi:Mg2+-importing ATPase
MNAAPFWTSPPAALFARLGSFPDGLTSAVAARRLLRDGANHPEAAHRSGPGARLLRRLAEPLTAILLVAAFASGITGDIPGFGIILAIVAISVVLDVVQESRAEAAAARLQAAVAVRAEVRRDGAWAAIPVERIVRGDVLRLSPGSLVPADGIVLAAEGAQANEAALTGEPYPVRKLVTSAGGGSPAEAPGALFAGTALVSGSATMLVVETGMATRLGAIATALGRRRPPTAFERGLAGLGRLIMRLTVFLVLFVLLAHLVFARPALESFLFALALAVGLTPELLPMVTTVTLSRGAQRMARRRVVVKRLAAIHDLGAMDVLCTDKTGTLTEARIALAGSFGADGAPAPAALDLAAVNAGLATGTPGPMDAAILAAHPLPAGWRREAEIPFDFERRRSGVVAVAPDGRRLLVVKGAPESVLPCCAGADAAAVLAAAERRAAEGLRLLAVAWRELPATEQAAAPAAERDLRFAGLCAFADPPRPDAAAAVAGLAALGVRVKILSGDSAPVVRHLAGLVGLPADAVLTGDEIGDRDPAALAVLVEGVDLFARLTPEQKRRVILALKLRGHTVGFMGDGINDAPAIRAADAGLSVEGAAEVARAAADLILLDPGLMVVAAGVEEGRRTYANVMKYVRMGTSSNFGNMLSMAVASLAIPFLPLLPAQVLLNNLLYDLSEIGIPFDHVTAEDVAAPHGWDMRQVLRFTLVMGALSSVFDIATFLALRLWFEAGQDEFRTAWFAESMATQILVIFLIRAAGPVWRVPLPHPVLAATSLGALAVALAVALGPFAGTFGFAPLPIAMLLLLAGLVAGYLAAAEGLKRFALRRDPPPGIAPLPWSSG